ncbi:hypothetical protein [Pseudodesulfovibrio sediminis]|uniref:Uncharacterized protein n=1 Tax=Pseudodesulfovibrio sediminis TaxID=2810563 RepID=A0ABN6EX58_9BACT|nr:hypothetical protein [Pseudodesulfovibrio sediminis]BCS89774.1 hypothetical protein PSDVSF_30160 [Pseudodesulfovibrio sediminis]
MKKIYHINLGTPDADCANASRNIIVQRNAQDDHRIYTRRKNASITALTLITDHCDDYVVTQNFFKFDDYIESQLPICPSTEYDRDLKDFSCEQLIPHPLVSLVSLKPLDQPFAF